jgi:hypothetical protein
VRLPVDFDRDTSFGQYRSTSSPPITTFGCGSPPVRNTSSTSSSKTLRVGEGPAASSAFKRPTPRRPRLRLAKATSFAWEVNSSTCAWRTIRRYALSLGTVVAQSRTV